MSNTKELNTIFCQISVNLIFLLPTKDFPYYYRRTDQYPSQKEQERWVR